MFYIYILQAMQLININKIDLMSKTYCYYRNMVRSIVYLTVDQTVNNVVLYTT